MLLKSDKPSYVQYIDESKTNWYFTVVSKDGEIGLITAHDLMTGELIDGLGSRMKKCIFVKPEEYADLIEELEALRDNPGTRCEGDEQNCYARAMNDAIQLVAARANPPPGIE